MNKVLAITTSILQQDSVSTTLLHELLAGFAAAGQHLETVSRDFGEAPVPHLDAAWLQALSTAAQQRNAEQQVQVAYSDALIAELQAADTVIIALPMYNFSLPSMLKAWVDHIARVGVTFKYTAQGPEGLLKNKRAYLVAAMGGVHDAGQTDFLRPYMKLILSFVGIQDVEFITADGLNLGAARRAEGLAAARQQIEKLTTGHGVETQLTEEQAA